MSPKVHIVLLNWNGWQDTLECLESVFRLTYDNFRVIVCDNGSTDGSVPRILDWAAGNESASAKSDGMCAFSLPPIRKPLAAMCLTPDNGVFPVSDVEAPLVVIQNNSNRGFAAGCNVGIRYALEHRCDYVWLLNNDTVVSPSALSALVEVAKSDPVLGIVGSTVRRYFQPESIQAYAGTRYNKWMARTPRENAKHKDARAKLDCILGCSMLVRRHFLEEIGLMDESYFLYFEELDWAVRCRSKFLLGYAEASEVYHKEGASIGSSGDRTKRSLLSEHYLSRNRILFTRRFYPWLLPSVTFWVLLSAFYRLAKGDPVRMCAIMKAAWEGFRS